MSKLLEQQQRFAAMVATLIAQAQHLGYQVTLGEAFRTPEAAALNAQQGDGIANSLHTKKLAIDLQLFHGAMYLKSSLDYEPLGLWWEQQGGSWGGRFGDYDHFSLSYEGVR